MSDALYLAQMELGPMQNFVYVIGDPQTRDCVVVDPAWEIDAIVDAIERDGMTLRGVLVTHTHQDHVGGHLFGFDIPGIEELLGRVPAKVYVHKAEREFLRGFGSDLVKVEGGDTLAVGRMTLSFIHTPGHTPGSTCFLLEGHPIVFSGDTLFPGGPGNTKLPGGDFPLIISSIESKLFRLPGDTHVLPGHGLDTTIATETPHLQEWVDRGW